MDSECARISGQRPQEREFGRNPTPMKGHPDPGSVLIRNHDGTTARSAHTKASLGIPGVEPQSRTQHSPRTPHSRKRTSSTGRATSPSKQPRSSPGLHRISPPRKTYASAAGSLPNQPPRRSSLGPAIPSQLVTDADSAAAQQVSPGPKDAAEPHSLVRTVGPSGPSGTANDALRRTRDLPSPTPTHSHARALGDRIISPKAEEPTSEETPPNALIKQPDSRPISQQQLAAEVKSIYSGLVQVENKVVTVVSHHQNIAFPIEQFKALIPLHRTLLHEHHDFFLASQHPSASGAIRDLAAKYSMPARMWKHGIHNFLELLRHRLPESLDYMLNFIYLAYQMMALLYETVPSFEETWIECLGDLARYRMAIEDEDLRDREIWTGVARLWYSRAVDKNPGTGRLYHHLAILARSHPLQQLASYCRSLTAVQPFLSTRESIMTLFEPTLTRSRTQPVRLISIDTWFITIHGLMFSGNEVDRIELAMSSYIDQLDPQITRIGTRWKEAGAFIAICNISAALKYGSSTSRLRNLLMLAMEKRPSDPVLSEPTESKSDLIDPDSIANSGTRNDQISTEWQLFHGTLNIALLRKDDPHVSPYAHITFLAMWRWASASGGEAYLSLHTSWHIIADYANAVASTVEMTEALEGPSFPLPEKGDRTPLPEDYLIRGQVWAQGYFPSSWFSTASSDHDERAMEMPSTKHLRASRVVFLAIRLAKAVEGILSCPGTINTSSSLDEALREDGPCWLHYDSVTKLFSVKACYANARQARKLQPVWSPANSAMADQGKTEDDVQMSGLD